MSASSPKEREESDVPAQEREPTEKESSSAEKPESVEETAETVSEPKEDTENKEKTKKDDGSGEAKKKRKRDKKKREKVVITEEDFGPLVDFTKKVGFVYNPEKAEFDIDEVRFERRPWVIPDVRSVLYLRRLERRHNKLVHGLASVRQLTPKQILKEESGTAGDL